MFTPVTTYRARSVLPAPSSNLIQEAIKKCFGHTLTSLSRVRQYIRRLHNQGLTSIQKRRLHSPSDHSSSKEEQWFAIWSVLFPDKPLPASPYVTDHKDTSGELKAAVQTEVQKFFAADLYRNCRPLEGISGAVEASASSEELCNRLFSAIDKWYGSQMQWSTLFHTSSSFSGFTSSSSPSKYSPASTPEPQSNNPSFSMIDPLYSIQD
jgi:hypothetical protein